MWEGVPVNWQPGAAKVRATGDTDASSWRKFVKFLAEARALNRLIDRLLQPATGDSQVVHGPGIRFDGISGSHIRRVETKVLGNFVELALDGESRLHGAVTALWSAGRLVREDAATVKPVARHVVRQRIKGSGVVGRRNPVRAVRAAVESRSEVHGRDRSVLGDPGSDPHPDRVATAVAVKDFFSRQTDLDRAPG